MILQLKDPIRRMYEEFKQQHKGAIMLIRDGQQYSAYYDDTEPVSEALEFFSDDEVQATCVTFSHIYLDMILPRLVKRGYRIAICEIIKDIQL